MHALLRILQRVYNEITHAIEFCPIQDWEYHMGVRIRTHAVNISMSKYKNILMTHPVFLLLPVYKHMIIKTIASMPACRSITFQSQQK